MEVRLSNSSPLTASLAREERSVRETRSQDFGPVNQKVANSGLGTTAVSQITTAAIPRGITIRGEYIA